MAKEIIITKRFRNNTFKVHQYLLKEFSAKSASGFLDRLEKRIDFISNNPEAGKISISERTFEAFCSSITIKFFIAIKMIKLKFFACLICERIPGRNLTDLKELLKRISRKDTKERIKHPKDMLCVFANLASLREISSFPLS